MGSGPGRRGSRVVVIVSFIAASAPTGQSSGYIVAAGRSRNGPNRESAASCCRELEKIGVASRYRDVAEPAGGLAQAADPVAHLIDGEFREDVVDHVAVLPAAMAAGQPQS